MSDNRDFFENDKKSYSRFQKEELQSQKDDLIIYILNELSSETEESLQESISEIKRLTGYELTLDAAKLIRRISVRLQTNKNEESKSVGLR